MLFRTCLCFTTTFLSLFFYFMLKLNLIYSMSFNSILCLSSGFFIAKTFSRALFTYTYYFLIISMCRATFLPILAFTTALSCLLLLSLNNIILFVFDTTSTNFTLLLSISFSGLIRNSIYSTISTLDVRNRMYPIFITSGYCMHYTPILILHLSKLYLTSLIISSISSSYTSSTFVKTSLPSLFGLPLG